MVPYIVSATALVLAVFATTLSVTIARRIGTRDPLAVPPMWRKFLRVRPIGSPSAGSFELAHPEKQRIAFVANPTKNGINEVRERALRACSIRYLPQPLWFHTTEDDPGSGAAQEALDAGADVVVAVGGDGTVRAVAETLAGSGVPLGILPMGTGNLFARNLNLPMGDTPGLLRSIIEGAELTVDVGYMDVERAFSGHGENGTHLFLVMAGAGIDAEMVEGADATLKSKLGWLAYFFAAIQHLGDKRMKASVAIDDGEPVENEMRTVLIANAGKLPGGFQLIPDASVTDGSLDVATLDARGGIVGWTDLFGSVVAQGAGIKQPEILKAWRTSRIDHARGKTVTIEMATPQRAQVDGESLGMAKKIVARIEPGALKVRVPVGASA